MLARELLLPETAGEHKDPSARLLLSLLPRAWWLPSTTRLGTNLVKMRWWTKFEGTCPIFLFQLFTILHRCELWASELCLRHIHVPFFFQLPLVQSPYQGILGFPMGLAFLASHLRLHPWKRAACLFNELHFVWQLLIGSKATASTIII